MKKSFIERVLKEGQVKTAKYIYEKGENEFGFSVHKYTLKHDYIDTVYADISKSEKELEGELSAERNQVQEIEESTDVRMDKDFFDTFESATDLVERTHHAIKSMGNNFLRIAAYMYEAKQRIDNGQYVVINGMIFDAVETDIYEYGKHNFGFSRGTVSDYINIAARFLKIENGRFVIDMEGFVLEDKYCGYSVSQLQALLPIKDDAWIEEKCNPEMTVRELKNLCKQWRGTEPSGEGTGSKEERKKNEEETEPDTVEDAGNLPYSEDDTKVVKEYDFSCFEDYNKELDDMDKKISDMLKSGKKLVVSILVYE